MVMVCGWHLPDDDAHFKLELPHCPQLEGRAIYQADKIQAAFDYIRRSRRAVDIGAHVGLWSWVLARFFQHVDAFEPVALHRELFARNVTAPHVTLHACGLGEAEGLCSMAIDPVNSGATHIDPGATGTIPLRTLDSFGLTEVDFVKIDVEGFERQVIAGARETLMRDRPVVIVEQKGGHSRFGNEPMAAVRQLQDMGATLLASIRDDHILGWLP